MAGFKHQFASVKGLSDKRRLPRLGRVRLGVKMVSQKTGNSYPKEVDYFVVPPEVAKIYGEKPKVLDLMFPINDIEVIFPQSYNWWGSSRGVKCRGDGERAMQATEDGFIEVPCPCERLKTGECRFQAYLMGILYKVSLGGIYQITLGSYHSTVDINSGLDYASALIGRFSMIPFKLKRVERETHHDNMKQIHYPLVLTPDVDLNSLNELRSDTQRVLTDSRYALPAPEDVNPKLDEGAVVVVEPKETKSEQEAPQPEEQPQSTAPEQQPPGPALTGQSVPGSLDEQILELLHIVDLSDIQKEEQRKELLGLGVKTKEARLVWLKGLPKKEAEQPEPEKKVEEPGSAEQPEPEEKAEQAESGKKSEKQEEPQEASEKQEQATDQDRDDILILLEFAEPPKKEAEEIKAELEGGLTKSRVEELKSELNTLVDKHLMEAENEAEEEAENQPITEKQHKLLEAKLQESGINRESFKLWLHDSLKYLQPYDAGKLHLNQIGSKNFQELMEDWDVTVNGFKTWEAAQAGEQEKMDLPWAAK